MTQPTPTPFRPGRAVAALALALFVSGCQAEAGDYRERVADPELLHASVEQVTSAMMASITSPPVASRTYAYSAIAAYEVLRQQSPDDHRSLAGQLPGLAPVPTPDAEQVLLPLAAVGAYLSTAEALVFSPEPVAAHREAVADSLRRMGVPRGAIERSMEYGAEVARHVLAWAADDGVRAARASARLDVRMEPGRWVPTPPAYMEAVEPNWGSVRPFALASAREVSIDPPAEYDMSPGSDFRRQVQEVYDTDRGLTHEQREIAGFWDCNPFVVESRGHFMSSAKKISPGGHWMGITAIATRQVGGDMLRAAEAYSRVSIALADGFISAWDAKYQTVRVRPVTVIQTDLDPTWQPALQTPPFPEYPSGHSVISTAAAEVLTDLYGDLAYVDDVEVPFGLPARSFRSFRQAADEAAISRLYGGIHFRDAIEKGMDQGRTIGTLVVQRIETGPNRTALRGGRPAAPGRAVQGSGAPAGAETRVVGRPAEGPARAGKS